MASVVIKKVHPQHWGIVYGSHDDDYIQIHFLMVKRANRAPQKIYYVFFYVLLVKCLKLLLLVVVVYMQCKFPSKVLRICHLRCNGTIEGRLNSFDS